MLGLKLALLKVFGFKFLGFNILIKSKEFIVANAIKMGWFMFLYSFSTDSANNDYRLYYIVVY